MIIHRCKQKSEEWHRLRLGKPSASNFHRVLTPKAKLSEQSKTYLCELIAELVTGAPLEDIETMYMQRGAALEATAYRAYEFETDLETEEVGLITTDDGSLVCSPDRLVGDRGGLELKCPTSPVHIKNLVEKAIDDKHKPQVQGCLYISERDWWDVVSYHPDAPLVIVRAARDDKYIQQLADSLAAFNDTMQETIRRMEKTYGPMIKALAPAKASAAQVIYDHWEETL